MIMKLHIFREFLPHEDFDSGMSFVSIYDNFFFFFFFFFFFSVLRPF